MGRLLDRDILITSVMPHMHWLGKDFTFTAVLPDGKTRIPLIKIDHWNFNWQGTYAFKEPLRVPKGSWFEVEAHFDNSDTNPANQSKPPKIVRWGEGTNDDYDKAALTSLQHEELAMVTADKKCEKDHVESVEDKVTEEYESSFREENASLLAKVPKK